MNKKVLVVAGSKCAVKDCNNPKAGGWLCSNCYQKMIRDIRKNNKK